MTRRRAPPAGRRGGRSAGAMSGALDCMKSFGSNAMPRLRASVMRVSCQCAGTRPVLAQCCTVLCRLPMRCARAVCPPNRWMIFSAEFFCVLMVVILSIILVQGKGIGSDWVIDGVGTASRFWSRKYAEGVVLENDSVAMHVVFPYGVVSFQESLLGKREFRSPEQSIQQAFGGVRGSTVVEQRASAQWRVAEGSGWRARLGLAVGARSEGGL